MPDYDFTQTRSQLVERALRLIGALSLGEATSGEAMNQGVQALNAMVKSWQNDHVFLWTVQVLEFPLYKDQLKYPLTDLTPAVISIDAMWFEDAGLKLPPGFTEYVPGAAVAQNELVAANDNVYKADVSGVMGTNPPSVNGTGLGRDGSLSWQFVVYGMWQADHAYVVNDRVRNGNNFYIATVAGTSAASGGPTGTGTNIVDGSVRWSYIAAITSPWAPATAYATGAYAMNGTSGNLYRAAGSGTSGTYAPNWIPTGATFMQPNIPVNPQLYWIYQSPAPPLIAYSKGPSETHLEKLAFRDYQQFVDDKADPSEPTHFANDNQRVPTLYVYPKPNTTYVAYILAVTKLKDWDDAGGNGDFPVRWLDALTYGLAANLGDEYGIPIGERQSLGQKAQMLYKDAKRGDRDQSDEEFVRGAFG